MPTVIVPWRSGEAYREAAWEWVRARYVERHPDWEIETCECPPGPWRKGEAIRRAVPYCDFGPVVIADADVWCEGIADAVAAVERGHVWAVPHLKVHRLTAKATDYLCAGCVEPEALECEEEPYNGVPGGGIVVVHRDVLLDVPFDPRFNGWGGEDTSWRDAMLTLIGQPWRGREPLLHLWHPSQPRRDRKVGSVESHRLRTRYVRANRRKKQMRALLAEIEET